jgi:hypothetical protein
MLFDALYFNENSFIRVREKGAHILIKCKEPEFREVLKNARFIFDAKGEVTDQVTSAYGFDSGRMCTWKIEITSGDFAGYPIKIAHLTEAVILNMENCLYVSLLDDSIICQILQNFRELPIRECVQAQAILILSNYK